MDLVLRILPANVQTTKLDAPKALEQAKISATEGLSPAEALRRAAALHSQNCDDAVQFYEALKDELVVALDTWEAIIEKTELAASSRASIEAATRAQAVASAMRKRRQQSGDATASGGNNSVSVVEVIGLGGAEALVGGVSGDIRSAERLTTNHAAAASLRLAQYLN